MIRASLSLADKTVASMRSIVSLLILESCVLAGALCKSMHSE